MRAGLRLWVGLCSAGLPCVLLGLRRSWVMSSVLSPAQGTL